MGKIILILVFTLSPLLFNALTMEQCVKFSLENNRELKQVELEKKKAEQDVKDVVGNLLPQLSLNVGYNLKDMTLPDSAIPTGIDLTEALSDNATDDDETLAEAVSGGFNAMIPDQNSTTAAVNGQLKLDQVVFLGGKLINGIAVAKKVQTIQEKNYQLKKTQVIFECRKIFCQTLLAKKAYKLSSEAFELASKHFERVSNLYDNGLVSEYDKLRAELEVAKLEPQVLQAENNFELAKLGLAKHLGMENIDFEIEGDIPKDKEEFQTLKDIKSEGLRTRKEIQLSEIMNDVKKVQMKVEKSNYLPNIAISGEYTVFSQASDTQIESDDYGNYYQIGIGLQMPIFTGFSNRAKYVKSKHDYKQQLIKDQDLKQLIGIEIDQAYKNYMHAIKMQNKSEINLNLANRSLTIAEKRYNSQIGIQLEVMDAQVALNQAKIQKLESDYNLYITQLNLKRVAGNDLNMEE